MRALPATLRAILLDPDADPGHAASVLLLPWQREEESPFPRLVTAVVRDGRTVATVSVTRVVECCHVVIMRRGRGGPGRPRHFLTLPAALAAAETIAVGYALGLKPRMSA